MTAKGGGAERFSSEHVGSFGKLDAQQACGEGGRKRHSQDENSLEHDDYLTTSMHWQKCLPVQAP